MNSETRMRGAKTAVALAAFALLAAAAQGQAVLLAAGGMQPDVVREIDDPHTGARWLLVRNAQHPGGPGRLVLAGTRMLADTGAGRTAPAAMPLPVIRAGERLIVEEHTPLLDVVLEAVALQPAVVGAPLAARLQIGGKVVHAVAEAPGRARLVRAEGGQG